MHIMHTQTLTLTLNTFRHVPRIGREPQNTNGARDNTKTETEINEFQI